MSAHSTSAPRDHKPFTGGSRIISIGLLAAAVGLGSTGVRALIGGEEGTRIALFSYLVAFAYWVGLSLAGLVLLMIFHAAKARWIIVFRRIVEVIAGSIVPFAILFIPIALGLKLLYPWAAPNEEMTEEQLHLIHHRAVWLNPSFFFVRAAIYFGLWILISRLLLAWSTRQDTDGAARWTKKSWTLGSGGLPAVALTLTFAAMDWYMSLATEWFSSMWGVYYFAGSFVGVFAVIVIVLVYLSQTDAFDGVLNTAHFLSLGKFLLAFTCFWAYIAFSQYMLVWIANLPDTIPWLLLRQKQGWQYLGISLIAGHFLVPFFLLLSRKRKMNPTALSMIALWILFMHYLDLYWMIMPQVRPDHVWLDWSNVTAFIGIGGLAVAFAVYTMRGRYLLPVGDPFLSDSLEYSKT